MAGEYQRLGDMLVSEGIVTKDELSRVITARQKSNAKIGELIVAMGLATEAEVTSCLARQYGIPVAKLDELSPAPEALNLLASFNALTQLVLPVSVDENAVYCVVADPLDLEVTDGLSQMFRKRIVPLLAGSTELYNAIIYYYGLNVPQKACGPVSKVATTKKGKESIQEDRNALLFALDNAYAFFEQTGLAA